jgi:lipopolysaccharide export system protein LptA
MSIRSPEGCSRYLKPCGAAILMLSVLAGGPVSALPDDREQPIHIIADKALRDEKRGVTIYSGNVQMDQGSMHLEGDKLTIYHVSDEADKIEAQGTPAKMHQQPELDKAIVFAEALTIQYFRDEERVHLQTKASIEQDGATVAGDSIDYLIAEQLVKADSNEAVAGNRVQVVIPPSTTPDAVPQRSTEPSQASAPALEDPNTPIIPVASSTTTDDELPAPDANTPRAVAPQTPAQEEANSGTTESQ